MTAALIDVIQLCEFTINYDTVEHTHMRVHVRVWG